MMNAVVRVGDGRGFVVEDKTMYHRRLIITAAHCLPGALDGTFPVAHPASDVSKRTYQSLLGPLGGEATVWLCIR
jgi:hypothetical protein